jgi:phage/plasmid-like protein (TIGR03299 family)
MHNLTERDGLFTVRVAAWHGLSTILPDYPTREEAKAIAHPWEPTIEPLYRIVEKVVHADHCTYGIEPEEYEEDSCIPTRKKQAVRVPEFDLVVRDDDPQAPPLGVKPDTRSLVTNEEMYDIAEALQGEGSEVKYETGGSLKGGRKVWLLLRLNEPITLSGRQGTQTIPYYALQNAHDGSGAFRGQSTFVSIVCDNTSHMADLDAQARGTEFTFRHTKNVKDRIDEAKEALAGWRESVEVYVRLSEHLIDVPVTREQRKLFVHEFIPMPQANLISDRVRQNVVDGRIKMLSIFDSPTQETIKDSAWGLVQGAVEYAQHYRKARTAESAFQRSYLNRSRLTEDALELAVSVTK